MAVNANGASLMAGTSLTTIYSVPGNAKYAYMKCIVTNVNSLNPNAKATISLVGGTRNANLIKDITVPYGELPVEIMSFVMNPGEALQAVSDVAASIMVNLSVGEVL